VNEEHRGNIEQRLVEEPACDFVRLEVACDPRDDLPIAADPGDPAARADAGRHLDPVPRIGGGIAFRERPEDDNTIARSDEREGPRLHVDDRETKAKRDHKKPMKSGQHSAPLR